MGDNRGEWGSERRGGRGLQKRLRQTDADQGSLERFPRRNSNPLQVNNVFNFSGFSPCVKSWGPGWGPEAERGG